MSPIIFITAVIIVLVVRYKRDFRQGYGIALRSVGPLRSKLISLPDSYCKLLVDYFPYYNKLSTSDKAKFERKLCLILFTKIFIPRNFERVTDEMKVLISASAVQLTFGLKEVYLAHFRKILIYPNDYYSSITKRYHKGEVNPAYGIVVISWHTFVMGYLNPADDGINLGLHEMAHALRLENIIRNEEYQFFDEQLLKRLDEFGRKVCENSDNQAVQFLRPYACTNQHEFFAVAIENFFERPEGLRKAMPELFAILTTLLNQNPISLDTTSKDQAA